MEGLNPNAPPAKRTEVTIQKWEYSDPVGVPHPDVVDAAVEVKNESGASVAGAVIEVSGRWRTGPFRDPSRAAWGQPEELGRVGPFTFAPHEVRTVRIPVNVAQKMAELQRSEHWPYTLGVEVLIRRDGSGAAVGSAQSELPILRGD